MVLIQELTFPFTFVGILFLNTQDHLLSDDSLQGKGFISRNRVPILYFASVNRTSTFAHRQDYHRLRILCVILLCCWNRRQPGSPDPMFKDRSASDLPVELLAKTAHLVKD
jgi:hypothetical protein